MKTETLYQARLLSPVGALRIVCSDTGIRAILWPLDGDRVLIGNSPIDIDAATHEVATTAVEQLEEYFSGARKTFDVPLDPRGTAFQMSAWHALASIPYGKTATYAEQAERIGRATAVRAIGAANGRNPISIVLPCHRVIGSDGTLTGFAGGLAAKRWLLDHEGASYRGNEQTLFS
jgi:methylated-DNA-[protein]-cysteine S-methyltransferase